MRMALTIQQRIGIIKDVEGIAQMSILDSIIAQEIVRMVMLTTDELISKDVKLDDGALSWCAEKDDPLIVEFNEMHMKFLGSHFIDNGENNGVSL